MSSLFHRDNNDNAEFVWGGVFGNRGRYKPPNTYNPVQNITVSIYSDSEKKNLQDSKTCNINLTNTWKCGKYVDNACTIDASTKETYADKYEGSARISYTIKSTLDEDYPECDCKEWSVDASGETYKLSCERGRYDEHTITGTIELAPNNKNKPYYVLTGKIITNRK